MEERLMGTTNGGVSTIVLGVTIEFEVNEFGDDWPIGKMVDTCKRESVDALKTLLGRTKFRIVGESKVLSMNHRFGASANDKRRIADLEEQLAQAQLAQAVEFADIGQRLSNAGVQLTQEQADKIFDKLVKLDEQTVKAVMERAFDVGQEQVADTGLCSNIDALTSLHNKPDSTTTTARLGGKP
jgi:hypothetical protein